jgi:hypothetical protein
VYNQLVHFKKLVKHVGDPMPHEESVASSAVNTLNSFGTDTTLLSRIYCDNPFFHL